MKALLIVLFIFLSLCCNQNQNKDLTPSSNVRTTGSAATPKESSEPESMQEALLSRKLIKEANLRIQVANISKATDQLHSLSTKYHGYMSNEIQSELDNRKEINTIIRVPTASIDSIIKDILTLAIKVDTKTLNTQDVSEEYIDINARLNTKKELEKTYLNLLKQTHNVNEVINIEKELSTVRGDIESMEGRLKYLNSLIRFASIDLSCYEIIYPNSTLWKDISLGITGGWFALIKFVILLFRAWPLLILIFILLYFRKRRYRNKK